MRGPKIGPFSIHQRTILAKDAFFFKKRYTYIMRLLANNVKNKYQRLGFFMVAFFGGGFILVFPFCHFMEFSFLGYAVSYFLHGLACYFFANMETYEFLSMINYMISEPTLRAHLKKNIKNKGYIGHNDLPNVQELMNEERKKF